MNASDPLAAALHAQIARDGPLPFDRYMEQVLYTPELGYYERTEAVFGRAGDFVTAPGLGELFGQSLAQFCTTVLAATGGGIAEYGPGDGTLANQLCTHVQPASYHLIERSSTLRTRQQQTLADNPQVRWVNTLPDNFHGVVIANELLDAQGARCFESTDNGIVERRVASDGEQFHWQHVADAELAERVAHTCGPLASGYRSEIRPNAHRSWIEDVAAALTHGVVLVIDYGYERAAYYHPQRSEGTLRMHRDHQLASDPFAAPGQADITVDVDFTALAESAVAAELSVLQFTTQAGFLLEHGLLDHAAAADDDDTRLSRRAQIEMLTHPQHMGERFRVCVLGKNIPDDLLPARICPDHRDRL